MTKTPTASPSNGQAGRNFRAHLISSYCCSRCWGALVERVLDGEEVVLCPRQCGGGFITQSYVEKARVQTSVEYLEVARLYPDLAPPLKKLSAEQRAVLFGEE